MEEHRRVRVLHIAEEEGLHSHLGEEVEHTEVWETPNEHVDQSSGIRRSRSKRALLAILRLILLLAWVLRSIAVVRPTTWIGIPRHCGDV